MGKIIDWIYSKMYYPSIEVGDWVQIKTTGPLSCLNGKQFRIVKIDSQHWIEPQYWIDDKISFGESELAI